MPLTLPNVLTLLRVAAIPLLVALFFLGGIWGTTWASTLFVLAAFTDWLDGWLARKTGQTSAFGAFLDPVADKLIVATALVLLVARFDNYWVTLCACVVIGREIVVSALREWMAELGKRSEVAVSTLAKYKTALQMLSITVLLTTTEAIGWVFGFGLSALVLASVMTLWTMVLYMQVFMREARALS